jgi:hypothetical protein
VVACETITVLCLVAIRVSRHPIIVCRCAPIPLRGHTIAVSGRIAVRVGARAVAENRIAAVTASYHAVIAVDVFSNRKAVLRNGRARSHEEYEQQP